VGSRGGAQIREEEGGWGRGVWIFIRPGAFWTMEHLLVIRLVYQRRRGGFIFIRLGAFQIMEHFLVTRVSVPASPGRMHIHSTRGISDSGALVGDEG
jgi:hypothetical protein